MVWVELFNLLSFPEDDEITVLEHVLYQLLHFNYLIYFCNIPMKWVLVFPHFMN